MDRERHDDDAPFDQRLEPAGRIGQHRPGDERRACGEQHQPDREHQPRTDAGAVPFGDEPGRARRDEHWSDSVPRVPRPEAEPAGQERPTGSDEGEAASPGSSGERIGGVVTRDRQRDDTDRQTSRAEGKPKRHQPIVAHRPSGLVRARPRDGLRASPAIVCGDVDRWP